MGHINEFIGLYRLYRVMHSRRYALSRAWNISTGKQSF